jgi:stage II sporulation protein D
MHVYHHICLCLIALIWQARGTQAQDVVSVGLFYGSHYLRAGIAVTTGEYEVWADNSLIFNIQASQEMEVSAISGKVNIYHSQKTYNQIKHVQIKPKQATAQMHIHPVGAKTNRRKYNQEISLRCYSGRLQFINHLELEEYVAGVIEAETGGNQTTEFYKVQAVISRTYAINNLHKHKADGFHVCDAVHCQVYHGLPLHESKTYEAAFATRDLVLVDHQINMIDATFHSNCGGETLRADEVWSKNLPHLQRVEDTFCGQMPHSFWRKSISRQNWDQYIDNQRHPLMLTEDSLNQSTLQGKPTYQVDSTLYLSRVAMREAFKLKSTKFEVEITSDSVRFNGRGFGHGVGVCQEGAMARANEGIRYQDILHTYYADVHLVPRYMLWFFKDEESSGD